MVLSLIFGCDHRGYNLKNQLLKGIITDKKNHYKIHNEGCFTGSSCDYPNIALYTCEKVLSTPNSLGVLVCSTGIGMSIVANKINGIRCALCTTVEMAEMARKHNNANVLALGGRIVEEEDALQILFTFCKTKFEEGRHQRRLDIINEEIELN